MGGLSKVLYVGVTNNVDRRVYEHKQGETPGFTSRYKVNRLVYVEVFNDIRYAIIREKQIKSWRRDKKIALIESQNPAWADLMAEDGA